ncbi:MAG: hypothetical protein KGQ52_13295 [Alphaproteobacteria bacterium]|nr:hypothetical protein [Alphaproteobacteria bacterium]
MTAELEPVAADWEQAHRRVGAAWHRLAAFVREGAGNVGDVGTIVCVPLPDGLRVDLHIMRQNPDAPLEFTSNPIIFHPPSLQPI